MYKISNLFPFNKMVATNPSFGISAQKLDAKYDNHYNLGISMRPSLSVDKFERNKISFGAGMEEKKRPSSEEVWAKVREVCVSGIEEPEYEKETFEPDNEAPSTFIRCHYDKNGVLRRKSVENYHDALEQLDLYNEEGALTASFIITVSRSTPYVNVRKYLINSDKSIKTVDVKVSLKDLSVE